MQLNQLQQQMRKLQEMRQHPGGGGGVSAINVIYPFGFGGGSVGGMPCFHSDAVEELITPEDSSADDNSENMFGDLSNSMLVADFVPLDFDEIRDSEPDMEQRTTDEESDNDKGGLVLCDLDCEENEEGDEGGLEYPFRFELQDIFMQDGDDERVLMEEMMMGLIRNGRINPTQLNHKDVVVDNIVEEIGDDMADMAEVKVGEVGEDMGELFIPKRVFIVPYRNRPQHKFFFSKWMSYILGDCDDYEIYFSHQCDQRTFNRGATKDVGFLAVKEKYPEHYRDMTFIFNDVDTIPYNRIFDYNTVPGVVKHHYGYRYALGGIVVIKGGDFEAINGFPCYWGWGMEDNALQRRCLARGLTIDRSQFYEIGSPEILQLFDGISRIISKKEPHRIKRDNGIDGLRKITQLRYTFDYESSNPADNVAGDKVRENENIYFINILGFQAYEPFEGKKFYTYDLREPSANIIDPDRGRLKEASGAAAFVGSNSNWTNIPHYPTMKENRENAAKTLVRAGKPVPAALVHQIELDRQHELETDIYNSTSARARKQAPPQVIIKPAVPAPPVTAFQALYRHGGGMGGGHGLPPTQFAALQQQMLKQQILSKRLNAAALGGPPRVGGGGLNKYSPYYARATGVRERATKSANIGLGGIMGVRR